MSDNTVTVILDTDEWYPVHFIAKCDYPGSRRCVIPAELEARARAAFEEFEAVQVLLESAHKAARND